MHDLGINISMTRQYDIVELEFDHKKTGRILILPGFNLMTNRFLLLSNPTGLSYKLSRYKSPSTA